MSDAYNFDDVNTVKSYTTHMYITCHRRHVVKASAPCQEGRKFNPRYRRELM